MYAFIDFKIIKKSLYILHFLILSLYYFTKLLWLSLFYKIVLALAMTNLLKSNYPTSEPYFMNPANLISRLNIEIHN